MFNGVNLVPRYVLLVRDKVPQNLRLFDAKLLRGCLLLASFAKSLRSEKSTLDARFMNHITYIHTLLYYESEYAGNRNRVNSYNKIIIIIIIITTTITTTALSS